MSESSKVSKGDEAAFSEDGTRSEVSKRARSFRPPLGIRLDSLVGQEEALRLGVAAVGRDEVYFDVLDYDAGYQSSGSEIPPQQDVAP